MPHFMDEVLKADKVPITTYHAGVRAHPHCCCDFTYTYKINMVLSRYTSHYSNSKG